jgi:hypothetical protein
VFAAIWVRSGIFGRAAAKDCVQSLRTMPNGCHVATRPGTLHATNRGSNARDGIACNTRSRADGIRAWLIESFELRQRCENQDIACNTLPYSFARLGLYPVVRAQPRRFPRIFAGGLR